MSNSAETSTTPSGLAESRRQSRSASLTPDLAALAQNGAAISIASCTRDGDPIVGLGIGCTMMPDGTLRILVSRAANERLIEAIVDGGAFAATFTATRDHSSFQVKASRAQFSETCPDDQPEIDRQATLLREGLVEIGFSQNQAAGYTTHDLDQLGAILLRPERVFSQTPGPGAGAELPS